MENNLLFCPDTIVVADVDFSTGLCDTSRYIDLTTMAHFIELSAQTCSDALRQKQTPELSLLVMTFC